MVPHPTVANHRLLRSPLIGALPIPCGVREIVLRDLFVRADGRNVSRFLRPLPSAFMMTMLELEKSGASRSKTRASPCGDQEGLKSCGPAK